MKGIQHYYFETIESTNTWAKEHVEEFNRELMTVVTASYQTAGRGRFKRHWVSPANVNIYATYCCWVNHDRSDIGHVPQLLALAAAEVLEQLSFRPALKWPNDVLLSGKKVAGILSETITSSTQRCLICGIGLNINMSFEELQKIDRPATSLLVESGQLYPVDQILNQLTKSFFDKWNVFFKEGFDSFFESFKRRSYLQPGQLIRFHDNKQIIEGKFYSLNSDGSITLELNNKKLYSFYAGEFL